MVEEEIAKRYPEQQMRCPVHLSIGQEAAAVGVCSALLHSDWAFSGHRNHAHYLAKGGDLVSMIAELYGKESGCTQGRGGSMHLTDRACGFIGATPIVGSTVPIAVGAALTAKQEGKKRVVVVFLGDGAMEAGVVSESLNFAALKQLPILFVCEDNLYSVYSPKNVRQPPGRCLTAFAESHGVNASQADGNDVKRIHNVSQQVIENIRNGLGPHFLTLTTYRHREHCGPGYDNDIGYRSPEEFKEWEKADPIVREELHVDTEKVSEIKSIVEEEIRNAFDKALAASFSSSSKTKDFVYAASTHDITETREPSKRSITYAQAINESQELALSSDPSVYLMGLGVPDPKGIFGTTLGLQEKFGSERVFDIPLSEHAMTGIAVGSSITGLRPILTHQRLDFSLVSIDQIVNQAAKWHYMFNGTMSVPMVIRMIIGRGWGQGPQHSQNLQSWFAHIPGLRVVAPSTARDAKGMMLSAIKDNSPVLIMEHRWLHNVPDDVPEGYYYTPLDKARIVRSGNDLTLVSSSYGTLECLRACEILKKEYALEVEMIDLRSLRPIDYKAIINSVVKTKHLIVVDHSDPRCGIASEVLALVAEECGLDLRKNPQRLTLPEHPLPTSHKLAESYYPTSNDIVLSALRMLDIEHSFIPKDTSRSADQPDPTFCGPF